MSIRAIPNITQTVRPSVAGTPVWYAESSQARTQLDISITIPSGNSRKLLVHWGSDGGVFPTSVVFDPAGDAIDMVAGGQDGRDDLRVAEYYLDTPPTGAKVVRITTPSAVWSVARLTT